MRFLPVILAVALTGCGGGSLGSGFFGFGGGNRAATPVSAEAPDVTRAVLDDGSVLIGSIEQVVPESALRGVILRVSAVPQIQGYHSAELVPVNEGTPSEDGIVSFAFRAVPPEAATGVGPPRTRRLFAAAFIQDDDLEDIRGFRILSRSNVVDLRR